MPVREVCCIGLGYVGLPTAALLAANGARVHGVDINDRLILSLQEGRTKLDEPDLNALVSQVIQNGSLTADTAPVAADVFIIAVPTPFRDHYQPDMAYVMSAVDSIAPVLKKGDLVILESTSPVGSTDEIARRLAERRPDLTDPETGETGLLFAYCPERVLPGNSIQELTYNSRSIGGLTAKSAERARDVYRIFCKGELTLTDAKTAEMTKLAENSFRDVNIAFANELAGLAQSMGIDVHQVIALANRHPRVNILTPGAGVGGHCIPVDPWFLVAADPEKSPLIRQARLTNNAVPERLAGQAIALAAQNGLENILVLGLTYKPDIGDFRESPSITLANHLARAAPQAVHAHDPHYRDGQELRLDGNVLICAEDRLAGMMARSLVILATTHRDYSTLDFGACPFVIDPSGFLGRRAA